MVERPDFVRQLEWSESERLREPEPGAPRFFGLARDGCPGAVELLWSPRARERLQWMDAEAPPVRLQCSQRRGARDVRNPGPGLDLGGDLGDRLVGHTQQDEAGRFTGGDAPLAQASRDGRADAAGTDDSDTLEHS